MYSLTFIERVVLSDLFALNLFFGVCVVICSIVMNLISSFVYLPHINSNTYIMNTPRLSDYIIISLVQVLLIAFLIVQLVSSNPENEGKRMIIVGDVVLNSRPGSLNFGSLNLVSKVVSQSKNTKVIVILNSGDEIEEATRALKSTALYGALESFLIFDKKLSIRDNIVALSQGSNLNFLKGCKVVVLYGEDAQLSKHLVTYNVASEEATGRELYIKLHTIQANKGPFEFNKITLDRPTKSHKCDIDTIGGVVVKQKKGVGHGDS